MVSDTVAIENMVVTGTGKGDLPGKKEGGVKDEAQNFCTLK